MNKITKTAALAAALLGAAALSACDRSPTRATSGPDCVSSSTWACDTDPSWPGTPPSPAKN